MMNVSNTNDLSSVQTLQAMRVPLIDLSLLRQNFDTRSLVIKDIKEACRNTGFFHVVNHGIPETLIEEAFHVNSNFFNLPPMMKEELISDDVRKPVRLGRLQGEGKVRDFLKLYAHPFEDFVSLWPKNPPDYREKMGMYAVEARKLGIEIFGAIMESLNLGATHLKGNIEQGTHIVGINSYPPLTGSIITSIGSAPHTDHSIITILVPNSPGLEVVDRNDGAWKSVPDLKGSLQVLVGDNLEVLSNGMYHPVMHRVNQTSSSSKTRLSIASFHNLGMDEIVEPAKELVDEEHPKQYRGSSLRDFVWHSSSGQSKPFIETIKIHLQKD